MGVYDASGECEGCGPTGYRVLAQLLPSGSAPPTDRAAETWTELPVAGGGAQGISPLGSSVTVEIASCPLGSYVWLATELHFDSGFASSVVSADSTLIECAPPVQEVEINIIPRSINLRSHGVIPVALLGDESLDIMDVDAPTLRLGPGEAAPAHDLTDAWTYNDHLQDVNLDGFMDLIAHFRSPETGIVCGDTEATLTGSLLNGQALAGTDHFRTVACGGRKGVRSFLDRVQPQSLEPGRPAKLEKKE